MRLFEEPKMDVSKFAVEDVITTSETTCDEDYALFDEGCF